MFDQNQFIDLKDDSWLERQTLAGQCVASCLKSFYQLIRTRQENLSLKDIEAQCIEIINDFQCSPTFLNYKGFPGAVCLSVNDVLVHGIPTDYILQDGDKVTLDLGATYDGVPADAAFTMIYGTPKHNRIVEMLKLCKKSLDVAITNIKQGVKLGVIGNTIHKTVKNSGFGLIENYGGHGISKNKVHAQPFVANKSTINEGIRIQNGLSIAIEPMLTLGNTKTRIAKDGWSVMTECLGVHFEHSVVILDNKIHIVTEHNLEI